MWDFTMSSWLLQACHNQRMAKIEQQQQQQQFYRALAMALSPLRVDTDSICPIFDGGKP